MKSGEIEGEKLDAEQVRSSIARRLGIDIGGLKPADRNVEGVVEMMLDATRHFDEPLVKERLFAWHASLFPTSRSGMQKRRVGAWRDDRTGATRVLSGAIGKERVRLEAPKARRLDLEMKSFLIDSKPRMIRISFYGPGWRTSGLSLFILSTMGTSASRGRLPFWAWCGQRTARNAFTGSGQIRSTMPRSRSSAHVPSAQSSRRLLV